MRGRAKLGVLILLVCFAACNEAASQEAMQQQPKAPSGAPGQPSATQKLVTDPGGVEVLVDGVLRGSTDLQSGELILRGLAFGERNFILRRRGFEPVRFAVAYEHELTGEIFMRNRNRAACCWRMCWIGSRATWRWSISRCWSGRRAWAWTWRAKPNYAASLPAPERRWSAAGSLPTCSWRAQPGTLCGAITPPRSAHSSSPRASIPQIPWFAESWSARGEPAKQNSKFFPGADDSHL